MMVNGLSKDPIYLHLERW